VLREEGFADADTVERLLTDRDLRSQVRGQVVWIDEAGLLSTRDMKRVFDLAKDEGCRVVLSGDSAQHAAVGRGDALRLLESEAGLPFARLATIRRQTNAEYRQAVHEISQGNARSSGGRTMLQAGIERLDRMGAVVEVHGEERLRRLAADYADTTAEHKGRKAKTALVVSPTHSEGGRVAASIREELRRRGRLGSDEHAFLSLKPLGLTAAERASADSYRGGEVVRFHQNAKGFRRGERVTVVASDSKAVTILRADGREGTLPLTEAAKFEVYLPRELLLAAGDRLRITQNGNTVETERGGRMVKSRLNNGDLFEVAGFTREGDIRLANGFVVLKDYGGIAQGYVVTSHASQGATVDRVLIALGHESLAAANRQQFYVSVSRGREAVRLYTDDKEALRDAVQNDASRLSATELLHSKSFKASKPGGATAKLVAMQRTHRVQKTLRERAQLAHWATTHAHGEVSHGRY
jgi:AAA domain